MIINIRWGGDIFKPVNLLLLSLFCVFKQVDPDEQSAAVRIAEAR